MNILDAMNKQTAEARRQYVALLQRFDPNDGSQAAALNRLRIVLGKTAEQVQADFAIVSDARIHQLTLVDDGESGRLAQEAAEAEEAVQRSVDTFRAYNEKWKASHQSLMRAKFDARAVVTQRGESRREAVRALEDLAKKRPDLFPPEQDDDSTEPPRAA
jgi:hypothetical protein